MIGNKSVPVSYRCIAIFGLFLCLLFWSLLISHGLFLELGFKTIGSLLQYVSYLAGRHTLDLSNYGPLCWPKWRSYPPDFLLGGRLYPTGFLQWLCRSSYSLLADILLSWCPKPWVFCFYFPLLVSCSPTFLCCNKNSLFNFF